MSDTPSVHDIGPTDLERFLTAVNASGLTCPVCTHDHWDFIYSPIGADGQIQAFALARTSGSGAILYRAGHLPMITLVCERCGYVRLHQRDKLEAWLDDNGTNRS